MFLSAAGVASGAGWVDIARFTIRWWVAQFATAKVCGRGAVLVPEALPRSGSLTFGCRGRTLCEAKLLAMG